MRAVSLEAKFGQQVRKLRVRKAMTQMDLAMAAGIRSGPQGVSRIENGHANPTLDTVASIAAALEVGLAELLKDVA